MWFDKKKRCKTFLNMWKCVFPMMTTIAAKSKECVEFHPKTEEEALQLRGDLENAKVS